MSENKNTPTTTAAVVVVGEADKIVSMYGAHKILEGRGINIRPQMLYTYGKKGYIATVDGNGKQTTVTEIDRWVATYLERKAARIQKIQDELAG